MNLDLPTNQIRFAELVGITQPRVSQLVAADVLTKGATLGEWLKAYCHWLREQAAGRASEGGELNIVQERARLAKEQADIAHIKRLELQRKLIPFDVSMDAVGIIYTQARDRLLNAGARLGPLLAYESDVAKCAAIIHTELHAALTDIASASKAIARAVGVKDQH
jgi:phage terminase Nu1 subunit (DNA packaging protein)